MPKIISAKFVTLNAVNTASSNTSNETETQNTTKYNTLQ